MECFLGNTLPFSTIGALWSTCISYCHSGDRRCYNDIVVCWVHDASYLIISEWLWYRQLCCASNGCFFGSIGMVCHVVPYDDKSLCPIHELVKSKSTIRAQNLTSLGHYSWSQPFSTSQFPYKQIASSGRTLTLAPPLWLEETPERSLHFGAINYYLNFYRRHHIISTPLPSIIPHRIEASFFSLAILTALFLPSMVKLSYLTSPSMKFYSH